MRFSDYIKTPKDRFDYLLMEYSDVFDCILEVLNTHVDITRTHFSNYIFSTEFFVDENKYEVLIFSKDKKSFVISFVRNEDYDLKKVSSKKYQGEVFSGVFGSIDMFLKEFKPETVILNTVSTKDYLIKFYDSRVFKSLFFKRNLNFEDKISGSEIVSWIYKYDSQLQKKLK